MRKDYKKLIFDFIEKNFWGIFYTVVAIISFIIILMFGIGVFVLLVLVGITAFVVGNSKDRNVSVLQNVKYFIDKINNFIKRIGD